MLRCPQLYQMLHNGALAENVVGLHAGQFDSRNPLVDQYAWIALYAHLRQQIQRRRRRKAGIIDNAAAIILQAVFQHGSIVGLHITGIVKGEIIPRHAERAEDTVEILINAR